MAIFSTFVAADMLGDDPFRILADPAVVAAIGPEFGPVVTGDGAFAVQGRPGAALDLLVFPAGGTGSIPATLVLDDLALGAAGYAVLAGTGDPFLFFQGLLAGDDTVFGSDAADTLLGFAGNDVVDGGGGDDNLNGNTGADTVRGGAGSDFARGGMDNDTVLGDDGDDFHLNGNLGDDLVFGGSGNDHVFGGQGNDTLLGLKRL